MSTGAYLRKVAAKDRLAGAVRGWNTLATSRTTSSTCSTSIVVTSGRRRHQSCRPRPSLTASRSPATAMRRRSRASVYSSAPRGRRRSHAPPNAQKPKCTGSGTPHAWFRPSGRATSIRAGRLRVNTLDVVIDALDEAYEHNETPSAAVGVDGDEVSLVVLAPALDNAVPEQIAVGTPDAGRSLQTLDEPGRTVYYQHFVCGLVVAAVREAFAVAPSLQSARVAVLRNPSTTHCLLAARFERAWLSAVDWYPPTRHASSWICRPSGSRVREPAPRCGPSTCRTSHGWQV